MATVIWIYSTLQQQVCVSDKPILLPVLVWLGKQRNILPGSWRESQPHVFTPRGGSTAFQASLIGHLDANTKEISLFSPIFSKGETTNLRKHLFGAIDITKGDKD